MNVKHYKDILKQFEECSPHLAQLKVDWRPRGDCGIRVTLKDGTEYDYDINDPAPRLVKETNWEDAALIDDMKCREVFAYRVRDAMRRRGHNQATLSDYTGISRATISNYLNCKSSATLPHIRKIAYALNCSVGELID